MTGLFQMDAPERYYSRTDESSRNVWLCSGVAMMTPSARVILLYKDVIGNSRPIFHLDKHWTSSISSRTSNSNSDLKLAANVIPKFTVIWLIVVRSYKSNKFHSFLSPIYKFSQSNSSASLRSTSGVAQFVCDFTNTRNHWRRHLIWMTSKSTKSPFWSKACNEWESTHLARHSLWISDI